MPVNYQTSKVTAPELYDLKNDISETTNVANDNPEVLKRLLDAAQRARNDLGDALTQTPATGARAPGRLK